MELADSSVWAQRRNPQVRLWFAQAVLAGEIATCEVVVLEVLAFTPARLYHGTALDMRRLPRVPMITDDWARVERIQVLLADRGRQSHRRVKITDMLIAATAERAGLTLVHYDEDFDAIANVTGQSMRWVAPRGSLGGGESTTQS